MRVGGRISDPDDGSLSAVQEFGILVGVVVVTATLSVLSGWRGAILGLLGILVWTQLVQLERGSD